MCIVDFYFYRSFDVSHTCRHQILWNFDKRQCWHIFKPDVLSLITQSGCTGHQFQLLAVEFHLQTVLFCQVSKM